MLKCKIRDEFEQIQKVGARQMEKRIKQNQMVTHGMDEQKRRMYKDIIYTETSIDNIRVKLVEVQTDTQM